MKVLVSFALIACFACTAHSQAGNNYPQWQHPVLQQLRAGGKNLLLFYNKDTTAFITISIIDKKEKSIYWFDCYGYYFDAVPITDNTVEAITTKRVTAFAYYDLISTAYLKTINKARSNFQANGSLAKYTPYEKQLLQIDDSIKFPSTLKRLIELDKQKLSVERQLREFHSISPARIKEDTLFSNTLALQYGSMQKSYQEDTTTTYYNRIALEPVYKAMINNTTGSITYYNRASQLIDEIPLEKDKMYSLLNEKTDVFLLYRGWLELQRFNIIENISDLKKAKTEFTSTGNSFNSALSYANQLLKVTNYKIDYLTTIDRGFVSQLLKKQYRQTSNSFTSGEAYQSTFTRGNKFYELTDARGNVMAVVTDRKIQHSTDGTTIDYYEPDVATATDYAPFGSTLPGRNYQPDKYRYGYNGKENDNDVKGEGNQQDYGMRIYDPRLGRFLSVDPLTKSYPELTPYQFASNRPIDGIDLDGKEFENYMAGQIVKSHGVAALNVIDFHHGSGELLKATYSIHVQGNMQSFQKLKQTYATDPGILHNANNERAKYDVLHPLPRTSTWGADKPDPSKQGAPIHVGDNMHIEISALLGMKLDIYVRFTDIQVTANSFSIQAATLYGHTDAGTINFSGSIDPKTGVISFAIHNETTSNIGGDILTANQYGRSAQESQWKVVLNNVENSLGGKTESKTLIKELSTQDAKKGDEKNVYKENLITGNKSSEIKVIE